MHFCHNCGIFQVTDYAIARRIVDLHARNVESVERVYAAEDIQRYVLFARRFQPKVCASVHFTQITDFRIFLLIPCVF